MREKAPIKKPSLGFGGLSAAARNNHKQKYINKPRGRQAAKSYNGIPQTYQHRITQGPVKHRQWPLQSTNAIGRAYND